MEVARQGDVPKLLEHCVTHDLFLLNRRSNGLKGLGRLTATPQPALRRRNLGCGTASTCLGTGSAASRVQLIEVGTLRGKVI